MVEKGEEERMVGEEVVKEEEWEEGEEGEEEVVVIEEEEEEKEVGEEEEVEDIVKAWQIHTSKSMGRREDTVVCYISYFSCFLINSWEYQFMNSLEQVPTCQGSMTQVIFQLIPMNVSSGSNKLIYLETWNICV